MAYILFPLVPCLFCRSSLCKAVVSKYCERRHQTAYCVAVIRVANWFWNKCLYYTVPSSIIIKSWSSVLTKVKSDVLQIGNIAMKKVMSLQTMTLEDNYLLHGDMFVMVASFCHISNTKVHSFHSGQCCMQYHIILGLIKTWLICNFHNTIILYLSLYSVYIITIYLRTTSINIICMTSNDKYFITHEI